MMQVRCQCGKQLKLPFEHLNKPAVCPNCEKRVRVVSAEQRPAAKRIESLLIIQAGGGRTGEQLFLTGSQSISVGKSPEANLRLALPSISRIHCRLVPASNGWRVEDNNSTNGLFANGRRVKGRNLLNGDLLRIGEMELRFVSERSARPEQGEVAREATVAEDTADHGLHLLDETAGLRGTTAARPFVESAGEEPEGDIFKFADEEYDKGAAVEVKSAPVVMGPGGRATCPKCNAPLLRADSRLCTNCGAHLEPQFQPVIETGTARGPGSGLQGYLGDCMRSFGFIADPGNLVTFLILAAVLASQELMRFAPCIGGIGMFIVSGWFYSFLFNVVEVAATGEDDLPTLALTGGFMDDVVVPYFKFLATMLIALFPAIVYVSIATALSGQFLTFFKSPDEILIILLVLGGFFWPMIILTTTLGGMGSLLRPDLILMTVIKGFVPYLVASLISLLALSGNYLALLLLGGSGISPGFGGSAWVITIVLWVGTTYFWIVGMRCIGLYYYHFKNRFAWSWG